MQRISLTSLSKPVFPDRKLIGGFEALDNRESFSNVLKTDKFVSHKLKHTEIEEALAYETYIGATVQLISKALNENQP